MADIVGGLRARLTFDSLFEMVYGALEELGWFDATRYDDPPGTRQHRPVTMQRKAADWNEPIVPNLLAMTTQDSEVSEAELGSALTRLDVPYIFDVYAESESLGIDLMGDVVDILRGRHPLIGCDRPVFSILDFRIATPASIGYGVVGSVHSSRSASRPDKAWLENWFVIQAMVTDHLSWGDDALDLVPPPVASGRQWAARSDAAFLYSGDPSEPWGSSSLIGDEAQAVGPWNGYEVDLSDASAALVGGVAADPSSLGPLLVVGDALPVHAFRFAGIASKDDQGTILATPGVSSVPPPRTVMTLFSVVDPGVNGVIVEYAPAGSPDDVVNIGIVTGFGSVAASNGGNSEVYIDPNVPLLGRAYLLEFTALDGDNSTVKMNGVTLFTGDLWTDAPAIWVAWANLLDGVFDWYWGASLDPTDPGYASDVAAINTWATSLGVAMGSWP